MDLQPPKLPKLVIFGTNLSQKWYTSLSDFYKNWLGEGVPDLHPRAKLHRSGFKNVGLRPQKSRKIAIFCINLPLMENPGGPQKKLNINAQLQTLPCPMTP